MKLLSLDCALSIFFLMKFTVNTIKELLNKFIPTIFGIISETVFTVSNSKDDNTNQKPTTDKKNDANNKTNNVTTTVVKNTTQKSTKTGDQTPVELLTIGCLVSLLAIIILKKKKVF